MAPDLTASLSTGSLVAVVLSSSLVTAALNKGLDWLIQVRKEQKSVKITGREVAQSLISLLTVYSRRCSDVIGESYSTEAEGFYTAEVPSLPDIKSPGWSALPARIVAEIFDLRTRIDQAQQNVNWIEREEGPPYAVAVARHECAALGHDAWKLVLRLRRLYGFGSFKGSRGFVDHLRREMLKQPSLRRRVSRSLGKVKRRLRSSARRLLSRNDAKVD